MGIIDDHRSVGNGLGLENSGVITKVGHNVKSLKVGDRIIGCHSGSFITKMVLNEVLCAKIPDQFSELSFSEGAGMAAVFCTAIYALQDIARLNSKKVGQHQYS